MRAIWTAYYSATDEQSARTQFADGVSWGAVSPTSFIRSVDEISEAEYNKQLGKVAQSGSAQGS